MRSLLADLREALKHWEQTDPIIAHLARTKPPLRLPVPRGSGFGSLVITLLHQQVSIAAGRSITRRLVQACGGRLTPAAILSLSPARIRACGVSRQKRSYIRDLARRTARGGINFRRLAREPDEAVVETLTRVNGIGVWTAKMFLLFHFRRPHVVSPEDLGLRMAVARFYEIPVSRTARFLERQGEAWRPYGSLASLTLWAAKNPI